MRDFRVLRGEHCAVLALWYSLDGTAQHSLPSLFKSPGMLQCTRTLVINSVFIPCCST